MPLYEYHCDACGQRFELIRKFSDPPVEICAVCGKGPVQRLVSSPAIQFKGTGWYITDYARKAKEGKAASADGTAASAGTSDGKSDAPKAQEGSAKTDTAASKPAASSATSDAKG